MGDNSINVVSRWKCPSCFGEMIYCGIIVRNIIIGIKNICISAIYVGLQ